VLLYVTLESPWWVGFHEDDFAIFQPKLYVILNCESVSKKIQILKFLLKIGFQHYTLRRSTFSPFKIHSILLYVITTQDALVIYWKWETLPCVKTCWNELQIVKVPVKHLQWCNDTGIATIKGECLKECMCNAGTSVDWLLRKHLIINPIMDRLLIDC
jgi:hypothetical protein